MNQTITLAPGDTLTVVAGAAGSTTTPVPPQPNPNPNPNPNQPPPPPPPPSGAGRINYRQEWNDSQIHPVPMGPTDELVIEFTTGSVNTTNNLPHIVVTEYGSPPRARESVLSEQAGDFSMTGKRPGAQGAGNTISAHFGIGEGGTGGYYPALEPSKTYYLNMRNAPGAAAPGDVCDVSVNLIKAGNL